MNEPVRLFIVEERTIPSGPLLGIHISERIENKLIDKLRHIEGVNWVFQENFDAYYLKMNIGLLHTYGTKKEPRIFQETIDKIIEALQFSFQRDVKFEQEGQATLHKYIGEDDRDSAFYAHSDFDHYKKEDA